MTQDEKEFERCHQILRDTFMKNDIPPNIAAPCMIRLSFEILKFGRDWEYFEESVREAVDKFKEMVDDREGK